MPKATPAKKDISIIERRLKSGTVFSSGSKPVPIKNPERWELRFVNNQISDARVWEMIAEKGWVYVSEDELAVKPEEVGLRSLDGRIVRGTHGHEVLMKMERADYQQIQMHKDAENRKNTFGTKANKQAIVNAANQLSDGGQAAEYLNRAVQGVEIKDSRELVSLED